MDKIRYQLVYNENDRKWRIEDEKDEATYFKPDSWFLEEFDSIKDLKEFLDIRREYKYKYSVVPSYYGDTVKIRDNYTKISFPEKFYSYKEAEEWYLNKFGNFDDLECKYHKGENKR